MKKKWLIEILAQQKKYYVLVFFLLFLEVFASIIQPKAITNIIDIAIVISDLDYFKYNFVLLILLEVLSLGGMFVSNYIFCIMISKIFYELKIKICHRTFDFRGEIIKNNTGKVITCLTNDINNLETIFSTSVPQLVVGLIQFLVSVYVIWEISPMILAIIFSMYPAFVIIQKNFNCFYNKITKLLMNDYDSSNQLIKEFTSNLYEYIVLNIKSYFINRFSKVQKRLMEETLDIQTMHEYNALFLNLMSTLSMVVVIGIGGFLTMKKQITNGNLIVLLLYIGKLFTPITRIFGFVSQIPQCKNSIERIECIIGE